MNGSLKECILATINEKEFDITCLVEFGYHDKSKFLTRKSIKWKIKKLFSCLFVCCVENYNNIYVFCFHEFLSNYINETEVAPFFMHIRYTFFVKSQHS